jgi:hypothetical protein
MNPDWPFDDSPDTACITTTLVLDGAAMLLVFHDYGGGWQFLGSPDQPTTADVGRVVSLGSMVACDGTLAELCDLPHGWGAVREKTGGPWHRWRNHPFATHAEEGYYLEDADWVAQYRDDVHPPPVEARQNLPVGTCVKLLFRFAAEDAPRENGQVERMWVRITEIFEEESYVGTLENDPRHGEVLACGDEVCFHPLHVMEIFSE